MTEVGLRGADEQRGVGLASPPVDGPQRAGLDGVAEQRSGAVRFHVVDLGRLDTGVGAGGAQHGGLGGGTGCHQAVGPTVGVHRRAPHDGDHPVPVTQRVGEPFEHGHPTALATDESVGGRVECMACAGGRHRLGLIEAARHDGREQQVDPAGDGELGLTGPQALAGQVDRDQRGGAGGVDGQRRAARIQEIGQPVGDDAQRATGSRPRVDLAEVARCQEPVLADAGAEEHTRLRTLQRLRRDAGMLKCFDGHLEHQALLRIDVIGLTRSNTEEFGVKAGDVGQKRSPSRGFRQRLRRPRGAVIEGLPTILGHGCHRRTSRGDEVPERIRGVDVAREPAAQPDDGDRFGQADGTAFTRMDGLGVGMGQRAGQAVDVRVLPDVDRGHVAAQQLRQFAGQHHAIAGTDPEFVERLVDIDVFGTTADVGDEVVDQPVAEVGLLVAGLGHTATPNPSTRWNSPRR